ncbi:MAG: hypothetical protein AAF404_20550, partial [Pseudomonadota bacterium]
DAGKSQDSKLLSRFGDRIFLFFMVTPPAETVVRAWERGKTTGRYKAVDDLLYHNIEAFTGMPALFLSWVLSADKKVHFEFLDNDVPKGTLPKTGAFGCNQLMTVFDVALLLNIDRYKNVNIDAVCAEEVLSDNTGARAVFLGRCIKSIAEVRFFNVPGNCFYAVFRSGELVFYDQQMLLQAGFELENELLSEYITGKEVLAEPPEIDLQAEQHDTLGRWGS